MLSELISPNQISFVPGWQISDSIVIFQEILHSRRTKKGKAGFIILKIDLEKAYDRIWWEFIWDTLKEIGLYDDWIRNIMACIETPKMATPWNGKKLDWFHSNGESDKAIQSLLTWTHYQ